MWLAQVFADQDGGASSKRVAAMICTLALNGGFVASCFGYHPDATLAGEVLGLAGMCFGFASWETVKAPRKGATP